MSELRFIDTWGSMFEGTSGDSLGPLYVFGYQPILQMKQLRMSEVTVWASLIAQLAKNPPAIQRHRFDSWVRKICWRRDRLPTLVFLAFLVAQLVKNQPAMQKTWVIFITPIGNSTHSAVNYFALSTRPWRPPICFLSLWIYLFSIFQIKGVIQCETFVSGIFHRACS